MILFDVLIYGVLFFATIPIWIYLYKHYLGGILADIYVDKIEKGEIDLNYLLDEGGVFDELTKRIVIKFKQHLTADLGQLTRSADGGELVNIDDPVAVGIDAAGELLKMIGMRKPPAILQFKVAQALGNMMDNVSDPASQEAPDTDWGRFGP